MALVLTNGIFYITVSDSGNIEKVEEENQAKDFRTVTKAVQFQKFGASKTKRYYVFDTVTRKICWKPYRQKRYSQEVRKMIYNNADGRCALCGRKITFPEMTLDHIVPLDRNGEDTINNLQCTCKACNQFKANIRPAAFMERITAIFMYQMEKKYSGKIRWKIVHKALENLI